MTTVVDDGSGTSSAEDAAAARSDGPDEAAARVRERRLGDAVVAVGLAALLGNALWFGRGLWFYSDEWNVLVTYQNGHWMKGFNGHLSVIPVAVFRLLLAMFGLLHYLPFQLVGLACYLSASVLLYGFARRRVRPLMAAVAALAVAWFPSATTPLLMPLLMNFSIPVALLLAAWWLLDQERPRADAAAALCLLGGVITSGVGLIALLAVVVELAVSRSPWRRWLVIVPAIVVWGAWYLTYYEAVGTSAASGHATHWGFELVSSYANELAAGWTLGRWLVLALLVGFLVESGVRRRWSPRAAGLGVAIVTFVVLSAIRNADLVPLVLPDSDRYLWLVAVLVVCLLVELARGRTVPLGAVAVFAAVVLVGAVHLHHGLQTFQDGGRKQRQSALTWFAAADALGTQADPRSGLRMNFIPVLDGDYLRLAQHYGSPARGVTLSQVASSAASTAADQWMAKQLDPRVLRGPAPSGSCTTLKGTRTRRGARVPAGSTIEVTVGSALVNLRVRRFAPEFSKWSLRLLGAHWVVHLAIPEDHSGIPWYVGTGGAAVVRACR